MGALSVVGDEGEDRMEGEDRDAERERMWMDVDGCGGDGSVLGGAVG